MGPIEHQVSWHLDSGVSKAVNNELFYFLKITQCEGSLSGNAEMAKIPFA